MVSCGLLTQLNFSFYLYLSYRISRLKIRNQPSTQMSYFYKFYLKVFSFYFAFFKLQALKNEHSVVKIELFLKAVD